MDADKMMGIQKPDMEEIREVKLRLPVHQLLKLHYVKLTSSRTFSDVVGEALGKYFDQMQPGEAA